MFGWFLIKQNNSLYTFCFFFKRLYNIKRVDLLQFYFFFLSNELNYYRYCFLFIFCLVRWFQIKNKTISLSFEKEETYWSKTKIKFSLLIKAFVFISLWNIIIISSFPLSISIEYFKNYLSIWSLPLPITINNNTTFFQSFEPIYQLTIIKVKRIHIHASPSIRDVQIRIVRLSRLVTKMIICLSVLFQ